MSRYELRDIADRLARSTDAETVASELIKALQDAHPSWRATLAFYEVSRDALVWLYERDKEQLRSREIKVLVDQLPPRMIRTFFHPSQTLEPQGRKSILAPFTPPQAPAVFEPNLNDAVLLRALLPVTTWQSCVCMPLTDRDEVLAVLTITSPKAGEFGPKTIEELVPVRGMAAFALSERLHGGERKPAGEKDGVERGVAQELHERIEQLSIHARELEEENGDKRSRLGLLTAEIERLARDSSEVRDELERVHRTLAAYQRRTGEIEPGDAGAVSRFEETARELAEAQRTQEFMRHVFRKLAVEHDGRQFAKDMIEWIVQYFEVDRCSLMLIDRSGYLLRIAEHHGIPPEVVERARVRVGQGVAGWVALHRRPLFVDTAGDAPDVERNTLESYNTDSFVCVPIAFNGRVAGVINLSNKRDGTAFTDADLQRAMLAAGVFAITVGANETVRRALAWAA